MLLDIDEHKIQVPPFQSTNEMNVRKIKTNPITNKTPSGVVTKHSKNQHTISDMKSPIRIVDYKYPDTFTTKK